MLRKLLIGIGIVVVLWGGVYFYFKDEIVGTVDYAKKATKVATKVSELNEQIPELVQKAKEETTAQEAKAEIKKELENVKQELEKVTTSEPPANLKDIHEKVLAHSDEAEQKIDEYIQQIEEGTFNPDELQELYEKVNSSPEYKEFEEYLKYIPGL